MTFQKTFGADGPLPVLKITAGQRLLTVVTAFGTAEKLRQTIIMATNT